MLWPTGSPAPVRWERNGRWTTTSSFGCVDWWVPFRWTFLPRGTTPVSRGLSLLSRILWLWESTPSLSNGTSGTRSTCSLRSSPSTGLFHSSPVIGVEAFWLLPCTPLRGGFLLCWLEPRILFRFRAPSVFPSPLSPASSSTRTRPSMPFTPGDYEAGPSF